DSPEYCDEAVEHFVARSPLSRPGVSVLEAPSRVSVGASKGHSEETFLRLFESFDVYPEEKGTERRISQHPGIERVEDGTDRRRPADFVVESHLEISGTRAHRLTVTRKKVAGIEVPPLPLRVFWRSKRATSSCCSSVALPFCSAAVNAFIVGP